MSIFGDIMNRIFSRAEASVADVVSTAPKMESEAGMPGSAGMAKTDSSPNAAGAGAAGGHVDVEAVLTAMAAEKGGGGDWRKSIVDLLKLLGLDSSLAARTALANELDLHVGADGSSEENIALHKAVMRKLEENGGKVPDSLKG